MELETAIKRIAGQSYAEDLFQEVWLAIRLVDEKSVDCPIRFILTVARRRLIDLKRRAAVRARRVVPVHSLLELPAPRDSDPAVVLINRERNSSLQRAINRLPRKLREAVVRKYVDQVTSRKHAIEQGLSVEGMRTREKTAIRLLRGNCRMWEQT
jgi:RNA polymerase sigma factor (sigma-70 family)